jgi:Holliday junction resolvasome RuvABC endonuclease subunit
MLALDLGQKTGWAVRCRDGSICSGTERLKPNARQSAGDVLHWFRYWLQGLHKTFDQFDVVLFESVAAHKGAAAAHWFGAFWGVLNLWCYERGLIPEGVSVTQIKKDATGRGNASKEEVVDAMRSLGFDPGDDNEADALALLNWGLKSKGGLR